MTDRLEFKGFIGSVHFSSKDETFFGKLEGVNDLVTFEGVTVAALKKSFIAAVLDYKSLCRMTG
jgi:predicted HicB family RNase H-like nuclease